MGSPAVRADHADAGLTDPSLMARLRVATREPHEALHVAPGLATLQAETPDPARYRFILERFDAFLETVESQVLIAADPWFESQGFRRQSRRPNLAQDLADLDTAGIQAPPTPAAPSVPALPTGEGAALGLLYITEGSRLGGRTMARQLAEALPAEIAGATRFLGSPGLDLSAHWRRVGAFIDAQGRDDEARAAAALDAATQGFAVLAHWFDEAP
ncbi:biliverdin-producing heme oxygenase [uncultured Rhodospira sp.]|uniref:biliverdin-producing heme oxygenase n=1 Tax=uncultured Rhodospira sp. TaxID=1936189 RepID=UPI00262D0986|nr:biliverdin-producing heme oxygenase [uncultured Rhodospira sp.]